MDPQLASCLELLEQQVHTLRLLSVALQESQKAIAELNLQGIYDATLKQETLCAEIASLTRKLQAINPTVRRQLTAATTSPASADQTQFVERAQVLSGKLAQLRSDVLHRNRVQAGLLRRSRRSLNALVNLVANESGTYQALGTLATSKLPITVGA